MNSKGVKRFSPTHTHYVLLNKQHEIMAQDTPRDDKWNSDCLDETARGTEARHAERSRPTISPKYVVIYLNETLRSTPLKFRPNLLAFRVQPVQSSLRYELNLWSLNEGSEAKHLIVLLGIGLDWRSISSRAPQQGHDRDKSIHLLSIHLYTNVRIYLY